MMRRKGYFVIADISGYARLLAQSELEQSHEVVGGLLGALVEHTRAPLIISRLMGDAVFSYAPDGSFLQGQTLLESIENMYIAFRRAQTHEAENATCACEACSLRPTLDLKIVVHYGEYALEKIGPNEDLHGSDVIVVHRLLKNKIAETTGVTAYAFFTEAAVEAMQLHRLVEGLIPHVEYYEHLGDAVGRVYDLHFVWDRANEQRSRSGPTDRDRWFECQIDLPVTPALAWDYLHSPDKKKQWLHMDAIKVTGSQYDRVGSGTVHQCVQGKQTWRQSFIEWQPFEHAAAEYYLPLGGVSRISLDLVEIDDGTRITVWSAKPSCAHWLQTILLRSLVWQSRQTIERGWREGLTKLRDLIQRDLTTGQLVISNR